MNCVQYEELCRHFLAQELGLPVDKVLSVRIPNPKRGNVTQYNHQIDLYWETGDEVCVYLNIANAKWRGSVKVGQGDVLLVQQVKQDVSAHKAVMITNTDFTSGAQAAAKDKGIALHIVQPSFESSVLHAKDRAIMQSQIQELASCASQRVFQHRVVHKAFDLAESPSGPAVQPSYPTKVVSGFVNKAVGGHLHKGGSVGGGQVGGSGGGGVTRSGGGHSIK